MKTCPHCHHKPSKEELEFYPEHCSQCGTLYSALKFINEKKRKENENLKAWRVTRWRPKYNNGLILGIPAVILISYLVYFFGRIIIANNTQISHKIYSLLKKHTDLNESTYSSPKAFDECFITVTAQKKSVLWLENQKTGKKIGPIQVENNKPKTILIEKGKYTVKTIQEEKIKIFEIVIAQKNESIKI